MLYADDTANFMSLRKPQQIIDKLQAAQIKGCRRTTNWRPSKSFYGARRIGSTNPRKPVSPRAQQLPARRLPEVQVKKLIYAFMFQEINQQNKTR